MPSDGYAFGSEYPMTETWLISNPRRAEISDGIQTLHKEVLTMMNNLMREPCMQDWVRDEAPELVGLLPPAIDAKHARECINVQAEFAILGEALWFLTRWNDGDFYEMIDWKKASHQEKLPYWVNTHDVKTALWKK